MPLQTPNKRRPNVNTEQTPITKQKLKAILGFGAIIDFIIIDQLSKWYILEHVMRPKWDFGAQPLGIFEWFSSSERIGVASTDITSFFSLTMVWNHGISFGLFQNDTPYALIGLAILISCIFSAWLWKATGWTQAIALAMVIGGAIGNVIDRLHFGAVADFLDFHINGWHYPAFNMADSFITIGIAILLFDSVFLEPKRNTVKTKN
ncbi:MAG: signal peptidase II [Micavibrio sp.]|nr:signal peptidase II [Micavibrio sp.]